MVAEKQRSVPNPPRGMRRITPHLYYRDLPAALAWLERVFRFEPGEKSVDSRGQIHFAEMSWDGDLIILSNGPGFPEALPPAVSGHYSQHIHLYVDDIQAFYRHCLDNGAECLMEPYSIYWGDVMFRAKDCEGHLWTFAEHVRDVAEEDLRPPE